ncbi:hypothetical protein EYZ11_012983 [Aspergillus tanneri]|uniref:Uncharacterized protein n=1 Tax=Aspergillus tanneri TaxID=1220188 RepID=A0A4S3IYW1_9EURO|nr:hypothetical protein EYZ11_012983 [Aspergillus tanneri]
MSDDNQVLGPAAAFFWSLGRYQLHSVTTVGPCEMPKPIKRRWQIHHSPDS